MDQRQMFEDKQQVVIEQIAIVESLGAKWSNDKGHSVTLYNKITSNCHIRTQPNTSWEGPHNAL